MILTLFIFCLHNFEFPAEKGEYRISNLSSSSVCEVVEVAGKSMVWLRRRKLAVKLWTSVEGLKEWPRGGNGGGLVWSWLEVSGWLRAKIILEFWYCTFFVYTILNFPRFFSAESGPSKVWETQNSVNKNVHYKNSNLIFALVYGFFLIY